MENINKRTEKSVLIYDYTNKIEQKVNELFEEYSDNEKEKVLFLLYLINKNTKSNQGYQIHSSNHKKFFGFAGNKGGITIQIIKNILVTNNVIVQVGNASTGIKSNKYSINNTFSWEVNKGNVKIAYEKFENIADNYLKKYVADDFVVKAKSAFTNNYIYQVPVQSVSDEVDENINDFKMKLHFQSEEIEILKEENRLIVEDNQKMKIAIEELQKAIAGLSAGLKVETGEEVGESNIIPIEEKTESSQTVENEVEDTLMNKNILDDDLDNDTGIEGLVEAFAMQEEQEAKEKAEFIQQQQQQQQVETNIFDLKKYKNNLSAELTENVTNIIYRFTKSHQAVDKVIKILNEGRTVEKSDMLTFGVSGAIVNQMYTAFQSVI